MRSTGALVVVKASFWVGWVLLKNLHSKIPVGEEHISGCWFRKTKRIDW